MTKGNTLRRLRTTDILARKGAEPLVCLTAYTASMAQIIDPHTDIILVGDSVGMVIYGMETTLGVHLEMMIRHTQAVMRGSEQALVVADLPFGSYESSPEQAFRSAQRLLSKSGCAAVKLEGGREMAETIHFLTQRGIPVMAHVGLMPQRVHTTGGFQVQGRTDAQRDIILEDALSASEAGAFCIVLENMIETLAQQITERIPIPTIGIGASSSCDGQILVVNDMLGLFDQFTPWFAKSYANLTPTIQQAVTEFSQDVRTRRFPGPDHIRRA